MTFGAPTVRKHFLLREKSMFPQNRCRFEVHIWQVLLCVWSQSVTQAFENVYRVRRRCKPTRRGRGGVPQFIIKTVNQSVVYIYRPAPEGLAHDSPASPSCFTPPVIVPSYHNKSPSNCLSNPSPSLLPCLAAPLTSGGFVIVFEFVFEIKGRVEFIRADLLRPSSCVHDKGWSFEFVFY